MDRRSLLVSGLSVLSLGAVSSLPVLAEAAQGEPVAPPPDPKTPVNYAYDIGEPYNTLTPAEGLRAIGLDWKAEQQRLAEEQEYLQSQAPMEDETLHWAQEIARFYRDGDAEARCISVPSHTLPEQCLLYNLPADIYSRPKPQIDDLVHLLRNGRPDPYARLTRLVHHLWHNGPQPWQLVSDKSFSQQIGPRLTAERILSPKFTWDADENCAFDSRHLAFAIVSSVVGLQLEMSRKLLAAQQGYQSGPWYPHKPMITTAIYLEPQVWFGADAFMRSLFFCVICAGVVADRTAAELHQRLASESKQLGNT